MDRGIWGWIVKLRKGNFEEREKLSWMEKLSVTGSWDGSKNWRGNLTLTEKLGWIKCWICVDI